MELPIRGIAAQQGVAGIGGQKRQRRENERAFELEPDANEEEPSRRSANPRESEGELRTAQASDGEAGSRLDITA